MWSSSSARTTCEREILHIVPSHSVAGSLKQSIVPCTIELVSWWDVLLLGPTPQTSSLEELSQIRTRYFRKRSPLDSVRNASRPAIENPKEPEYRRPSLRIRDRRFRRSGDYSEVALWFGPVAEEQMSLVQVLATLGEMDMRQTVLTLVTCPKLGMGCYGPEKLLGFFETRRPIPAKQISTGRRAWDLYCSNIPEPLFRFARRTHDSFPLLANAILLQLQEYPSAQNGLSVLEEKLLLDLSESRTVVESVVRALTSEPIGSFGDQLLFEMVWRFLHCRVPLVEPQAGSVRDIKSWHAFCQLKVSLTAAGEAVLQHREDNVGLNGIDRWIGGVHLKGKTVPWRWDREKCTLRRSTR
jgi:hypothetical protein